MLDKETIIKVKNRSNTRVCYKIQDLGIERRYEPGEVKEVTMEELRKLSWRIGGANILRKYLVLGNQEAIEELIGNVEPEYHYSRKDVEKLLSRGTLNQLLDCLDFAPNGVIDMVKEMAVKLEISDLRKRNAIFKSTGFDVSRAIRAIEETRAAELEAGKKAEATKKSRRAAPIVEQEEEKAKPKRRTTAKKKADAELEDEAENIEE